MSNECYNFPFDCNPDEEALVIAINELKSSVEALQAQGIGGLQEEIDARVEADAGLSSQISNLTSQMSQWTQYVQALKAKDRGTTLERPLNPVLYQTFFDTTIKQDLMYQGKYWVTVWGGLGQRVDVRADSLEDALTKYPGWELDTDSVGRVIVGAGAGEDLTERLVGTKLGTEDNVLTFANMPAEVGKVRFNIDVHTSGGTNAASDDSLTGSATPVNNMQPSLVLFRLRRKNWDDTTGEWVNV